VTASPAQLAFDFDVLTRELRDHRRIETGAERLLVALVHGGLAERDLPVAAALALALDERHDHQGAGAWRE
jgi:hypothetical protein